MMRASIALLTLLSVAVTAVQVKTSNGTVQGGQCSKSSSSYYFGIPFAAPPVGELRYAPPQPFSGSYNGTLDGTIPANICYQFGAAGGGSNGTQSEDCLHLDVYAPPLPAGKAAWPVKVWIYGGSFETGASSDPLYNGCILSTDAVVVAINYRLGPFGYLSLEGTAFTGNYGLQDQLQALRWVHDNVAAFGGDPTKILLFGQSAGAISSFALATLPGIQSLIKAVVMESGGGIDLATVAASQTWQSTFVKGLNCSLTDVACIRSKTPAQLAATYQKVAFPDNQFVHTLYDFSGAEIAWGPRVGAPLLPSQPSEVGVQVPAIFGSNAFEASSLVAPTFPTNYTTLSSADYEYFINVNFGPYATDVMQRYPLSSFNGSVLAAMSIVGRDSLFRCTAFRGLRRALEKGIPAWTYSFSQTPTCPWAEGISAKVVPLLGAAHGSEIPYVFGEVDDLPPPTGNCSLTAGEKQISSFMRNAWTGMAANATPGPDWPEFSAKFEGVNLEGGVHPGVVDFSMCTFMDDIAAGFLAAETNGTINTNGSNGTATVPVAYQGGASMVVCPPHAWSSPRFF